MRTISEGQAILLLQDHFSFAAPIAFEDVKKKYRQETKRLHPDAGGSEEAFKALSSAFASLQELYQRGSHLFDAEPMDEKSGEVKPVSMPRKTVDGIPLSELGLGLGPTTNGRECPQCDQRGYTVVKEHGRGKCQKCEGLGHQHCEYRCRFCQGTGLFTQSHSGKEVPCRKCTGTGTYVHPFNTQRCTVCYGSGKGASDHVTNIYILKCYECRGTGEIEVWNPVIPKGRLMFTGVVTKPASVKTPGTPPPPKPPTPKPQVDPEAMRDLLRELQEKGVGGKR